MTWESARSSAGRRTRQITRTAAISGKETGSSEQTLKIILAGVPDRGVFSTQPNIPCPVEMELGFIRFSHLFVTNPKVAPCVGIVGALIHHHLKRLDCGIEILRAHVHDADLFKDLPKCEQALGAPWSQLYGPQAGFEGIGVVTQFPVTGPPVVPDIGKGSVHLKSTNASIAAR